jgi:hypothetical protein
MLRDITGEDMKEAFNVSLGERLRKFEHEIKAGDDEADPDDALHQFQSQFSGRKLSKGTRIVFVWDHHGALFRRLPFRTDMSEKPTCVACRSFDQNLYSRIPSGSGQVATPEPVSVGRLLRRVSHR